MTPSTATPSTSPTNLAALARQTAAAVARWTALAMGISVVVRVLVG